MFQATNSRMPASTASGTCCASGAATSTTTSSVSACTMPATGECAPARTLVTVRAMVPVAGMPPKKGDDDVGDALRHQFLVGVVARQAD